MVNALNLPLVSLSPSTSKLISEDVMSTPCSDLFISFKADNGYSLVPNTYWPTVDPNNVNVYQELSPTLSLSSWQEGGFWIYLSEIDFPFEEELNDSVFVDPFDYDARYYRFKDTMMVSKGNIQITANMNWVE